MTQIISGYDLIRLDIDTMLDLNPPGETELRGATQPDLIHILFI